MNGFFSLDSKFMQALSRIADLMILNVVYLLTCLPIVTIGAANSALYTVCFRLGTKREGHTLRDYFRAFRDNFRQGTVLWLFLLLFGAASCVNAMMFYSLSGQMHYLFVLFAFVLVIVLMLYGYTFPLQSQFQNSCKDTLKNAMILSVGYLPRTIVIVAFNVFPAVLLLVNLYVFLQAGVVWLAIYFSAAAYLNTSVLRKVFAPYLGESEEEAQ